MSKKALNKWLRENIGLSDLTVMASLWEISNLRSPRKRPLHCRCNEMVSLGDTSISVHILQLPLGGVLWVRSVLESGKKTTVFNLGGVLWVRSVLESGKKIRVFNFQGGCYG